MPIVFNWVGSGPGLQRWQNALVAARTTNAFNALEAKLIAEGTTHVTINVVESFLGQLSQTFVEAANPATLTLNLHPTNAIYVDHADGTRGPILDAATFGHGLAHLTADRVPGANAFDTREERRVIEIEDAIAFDLGGSKRADLSFWGKLLESVGAAVYPGSPDVNKCFAPGTPILLADGTTKPIEDIQVDDLVLAFDDQVERGRGSLQPHRVIRLFQNVTDEWLELSPIPDQEGTARVAEFFSLTVTPGHRFLKADGRFEAIGTIIERAKDEGVDAEIILANGTPIAIQAKHILRSEETASLYDNGMVVDTPTVSSLALKPRALTGWRSYNFEVEELNTYVAGGIRVHNESKLSLVAAGQQFDGLFDHKFDGSSADVGLMMGAIVDGRITAYQNYTSLLGDDRYAASAYDFIQNKIIISANELGYTVSNVHEMGNGVRTYQVNDTSNTYSWNREIALIHPDFIDKIVINDNGAVASAQYYGAALAGDVGGAIGSSLGKLLGGNSLIGQVAAGTLAGAIGKEVGEALFMSASYSLDVVVANGLANVPGGFAGGLPGAAIGAISSLLMGEVADALHLSGFEHGLFQTVGTTITSQLVTNAYQVAVVGAPTSTLFSGFNTEAFAGNVTGAIGGYLGSTLAAHVVIPHYPEGALGQQVGTSIGGSVGGIFGFSVGGPLGAFMFSAIGSFVGGAFGTFIGDLVGDDPEAHGDLVFDFTTHRFKAGDGTFGHSNGGDATTFYLIAQHQASVVNAIADYAGVQLIGLQTVGTPWGAVNIEEKLHFEQDGRYFTIREDYQNPFITLNNVRTRDDLTPLVDSGIMQVLRHTHITGGDPLVQFAWTHSQAQTAAEFGFDLQVAKDYRTYLDDKPMIDVLMAAEPESSFTLGWLLTLLKARELGLDAQPASDSFRNGNDTINGTSAHEALFGGAGNDDINGDGGNDRMRGDAGNDLMRGGVGNDFLIGGADHDTLNGDDGDDTLLGGAGNDALSGGTGSDHLDGGADQDTLNGNDGDDKLLGGAGNDALNGGAGSDHLDGGAGDDSLRGEGGNDTLVGGDGNDVALFSGPRASYTLTDLGAGNVGVTGPDGADVVSGIERLQFSDQIFFLPLVRDLGARRLMLTGLAASWYVENTGNFEAAASQTGLYLSADGTVTASDTPLATLATPLLAAGASDHKTVSFTLPGDLPVAVYYVGAIADTGAQVAEANELDNLSNLIPIVLGNNSANTLTGTAARDTMFGLGGNDILNGEAGADMLTGGGGADRFMFDAVALADAQSASQIFDRVIDYDRSGGTFNPAEGDQLDFSALLAAAYNHGSGQPVAALLRAVAVGTGARLQIDTDGAANGTNWTTIGWLDGVRAGNAVNVVLDPAQPAGVSIAVNAANLALPAADFTGDGKADILLQNTNGQPAIWAIEGLSLVDATLLVNPAASWHIKSAADFNGDGMADILWQNDDGRPAIWTMNGTALASGAQLFNPSPSWHVMTAADFSGDGKADILWQNDSGLPAIWTMDGAVMTAGTLLPDPGPTWHLKAAADFTGDGKPDILLQNDSGLPAIWTMNGTSMAGATLLPDPGPTWHVKAAADFTGDGTADILWQNDSGQPAIWTMNGTGMAGATFPYDPGPTWHIVNAADITGDGKADIVWQNDNGTPAVWAMDGPAMASGALLPNPSPEWHLI